MTDRKNLTAPCGLDCFNCELYAENLTTDFSELIQKVRGVPAQDVSCNGCRQQDGNHFHLADEGCATLDCVKAKGVDFCFECDSFPCALLAPIADGASRYPHNMKLYNLCRINRVGLAKWLEEAAGIREKYFNAKFVVGKGQGE